MQLHIAYLKKTDHLFLYHLATHLKSLFASKNKDFLKFTICHSKYFSIIRATYEQHAEEDDPERIQQIIERSVEDAQWIVKKYNKK